MKPWAQQHSQQEVEHGLVLLHNKYKIPNHSTLFYGSHGRIRKVIFRRVNKNKEIKSFICGCSWLKPQTLSHVGSWFQCGSVGKVESCPGELMAEEIPGWDCALPLSEAAPTAQGQGLAVATWSILIRINEMNSQHSGISEGFSFFMVCIGGVGLSLTRFEVLCFSFIKCWENIYRKWSQLSPSVI